jgi:hypothetical protein
VEMVLYVAALTWIFSLARITVISISRGDRIAPDSGSPPLSSDRALISQYGD